MNDIVGSSENVPTELDSLLDIEFVTVNVFSGEGLAVSVSVEDITVENVVDIVP